MENRNNLSNECQVARDLMPLCADQAASEGSQAYVTDHMAACRECAAYYEGMMSRLPAKTDAERQTEQVNFTRVRRRIQHRRALKFTLIIASVLALAIAGVFVGLSLHNQWYYSTTAADLADYDIALAQLSDGRVVVSMVYNNDRANWVAGRHTYLSDRKLYVFQQVFRGDYHNQVTAGPATVLNPGSLDRIMGIYKGETGNAVLVWSPGDEIPTASPEMEAYYALKDYMDSTVDTAFDRAISATSSHTYTDAIEEANLAMCEAYRNILSSQEDYLFSIVPEWQPFNSYARLAGAAQSQEMLDQCYDFFDGIVSISFINAPSASAVPPGEDEVE